MSASVELPLYLDAMLGAWHRGLAGRAIHFGYWPQPPTPPQLRVAGAFARAQARLDALVLDAASVEPGCRILDVGCGLGATLEALDRAVAPLTMTGVNVDARQLEVCRALRPRPGNHMRWVLADACALPFGPSSFDRVLCVEAVFHFRSRGDFLREVARVLAPGGSLVLTDLRARRGADADAARDDPMLAAAVAAAFGPWPEFWVSDGDSRGDSVRGLALAQTWDLSVQTLPTHVFTAAPGARPGDPMAAACAALARLHREGRLDVVLERYVRA